MPAKKIKKPVGEYVCECCGTTYSALTGNFYKTAPASQLWSVREGYAPICKKCIDGYKSSLAERYGSEETAMKIICHYMDWYYNTDAFAILSKNNGKRFSAGTYSRMVNNTNAFGGKSFMDSLFDGQINKSVDDAKGVVITHGTNSPFDLSWDERDEKNRKYVIETYGYDPLEDLNDLTIADKKFCYNALSGYCDTEGIAEDGHKMMCVVSMVKTFLQIKKLDEEINRVSNGLEIDQTRIKTLMGSKRDALATISSLAKDNNISSQWNRNVRTGQGTMSDKIKEMYENGFEPVKVNLFDIKTCESMKQTADMSFQSIMEQLQLDENDYTRVIKNQREMVQELQTELDKLKEENRQLSNEVLYYKNKEENF